ncbi:MAG TPA: ABC transporter permease [Acidimicrobiales bacterium]|jgi:spermidine/putrescine transport system permease protein|nr:spermidine/putrescine ABC transporter permease [Acidimicrobiaceae bacterium]MDP6280253.1 ABC transporter permease [Acidimicrobiales bacterium]MDP7116990.1 ABC transporter permease [Acidimicrobiales bacterium]MDP7410379.1 ABC transporter permease [Acidimicrobiales bacterium]MEE1521587.1 ABC transporter permease [Acidimicrobiales bacterium]|tara:strand:+ start:7170 stop:8045 length:876 start_codon:yes stop_codon:yes gene_type:complete
MDVVVDPGLEHQAERARSRQGFLMGLPAIIYLFVFFVIPLGFVVMYSFATRTRTGRTELAGWNVEAYERLGEAVVRAVAFRSLWIAAVTTLLSLVLAYPLAYFISTRRPATRNMLLVGVMIPFWSNFLIRTYAWRVLLDSDGIFTRIMSGVGLGDGRILFTNNAVILGLVYGYLPFMVLPLYAAIERIDWSLVEGARDLYASGWSAFRRVVWPLSKPGVIAGSILVFVPSFGAYVTPAILGGNKKGLMGSYIVDQFMDARNGPLGSSLSVLVLVVMLMGTLIYFRQGGRSL